MEHNLGFVVSDEAASDVSLVLRGYTVSKRGCCLTCIASEYVMRNSLRHCVRLPIETVDPGTLAAAWANFSGDVSWTDAIATGPETGKGPTDIDVSPPRPALRRITNIVAAWPVIPGAVIWPPIPAE
jgi:hypothetical protein